MKKIYLGTNTKMYKNISDTVSFITRLKELTEDISKEHLELFVIPSYTSLKDAVSCVKNSSIKIGAQNMCWEDEGQFTGEISPLMLEELGVSIVEIGHSERRHVLGETDEAVKNKAAAAIRHGFTPLLCIGETKEQKDYNISDEILRMQLKIGLNRVGKEEAERLWVAYEPVWAIGVNGIPANETYANEKQQVIKKTLCELFGEEVGKSIPVLYGGSVNEKNAVPLIRQPYIDGLFIGRSAWDAKNFNRIIREVLSVQGDGKEEAKNGKL